MTGSTVDTHIDQVFFGWRPDGGLSPVASSYLNPEDTQRWYRRLQKRLRLQPVGSQPIPPAAFSYLCFGDGKAAFVRRVSAGVSEGRNNSLALIGSGSTLGFDAAIGLSTANWADDPPQNAQISPVAVANVQQRAANGHNLLSVVREYENDVAAVLAGLIASPAAALSVLNSAEPERLAIVWALHEVATRYLVRRFDGRPDWSFSTYEDQHDTAAGELPGIVFLPAAQPGAGTVRRLIVDLRHPRVGDAELALAHRVLHYLINSLPADPSIDDVPAPRPAPPVEPGLRTGEVPTPAQRPSPVPARTERTPVSALLDSDSTATFLKQLSLLESFAVQHGAVMYPHLNQAMLDELAAFVQVDIPDELQRRVLRVTYGEYPERELTNADAEKHATRLIKRGQSDQLAGLLAAMTPSVRPIRDAAFERLASRAGRSATRSNGFAARQWRRGRYHHYFRWAAIVAVLAVLAMVFLAGYLVGRPGSVAAETRAQTAAGRAPVTTRAPAATTPAPPPTTQQADQNQNGGNPDGSGAQGVTVSTDPGREIWMFRPENDGFVVLGRCLVVNGSDRDWLCTPQQAKNGDRTVAMSVPAPTSQRLSGQVNAKVQRENDWGKVKPL